jgi:hypothetical protein
VAVARSIRIEHAGAFYHVMARGNHREEIFQGDYDRQLFLKTLSPFGGDAGREPGGGMQRLQITYTRRTLQPMSRVEPGGKRFGETTG